MTPVMTTHDVRFGGWIWRNNLKPFLSSTASALEVEFDDDDWEAVLYGIQGTSDVEDRWFDYELIGCQITVGIALALDEGGATDIVLVRVVRGVDFIAEAKIQTLLSVCSSYDVTSHKA